MYNIKMFRKGSVWENAEVCPEHFQNIPMVQYLHVSLAVLSLAMYNGNLGRLAPAQAQLALIQGAA